MVVCSLMTPAGRWSRPISRKRLPRLGDIGNISEVHPAWKSRAKTQIGLGVQAVAMSPPPLCCSGGGKEMGMKGLWEGQRGWQNEEVTLLPGEALRGEAGCLEVQ